MSHIQHKLPSLDVVKDIDLKYLSQLITGLRRCSTKAGSYEGKCPFCHSSNSRSLKDAHNRPAFIYPHPNGEGFGFKCCSCKAHYVTTFKLLVALNADSQQYALDRWNAGTFCGRNFNCPIPLVIKEQMEVERKARALEHRQKYEQQRQLNKTLASLRNGSISPIDR
jgi:hypothetical protein